MSSREDFREILRLVRPGARVLDVGCGEGELLEMLVLQKGVDGRGLEISPEGVSACLARGLAVVQGDADSDLDYFPDRAFDYAILSQTLPQVRQPRRVLSALLRIAERAIVSLPNFGHWRVRLDLLSQGRMPLTRALDYFDLAAAHSGSLAEAFRRSRGVRFCVLSFSSDWLYPTPESRHIVRALNAAGARASFVEIETDKGHDAFLLDEPVMKAAVSGFLDSAAQARGLK